MFQLQVHKSNDRYEFSAQLMTISWWSLLRAVDVYNSTSFSLMCACLKAFWEHHLIVCHKNKLVREMLDWRAATSAAAELQFNKNFYALFFIAQTCPYFIMNLTQSSHMQQNRDAMISSVYNIIIFFHFIGDSVSLFRDVVVRFWVSLRVCQMRNPISKFSEIDMGLLLHLLLISAWKTAYKFSVCSCFDCFCTAKELHCQGRDWNEVAKHKVNLLLDWTVAFVHIDSAVLPASTLCGERKVVEHNWKSKRIKRFHE